MSKQEWNWHIAIDNTKNTGELIALLNFYADYYGLLPEQPLKG